MKALQSVIVCSATLLITASCGGGNSGAEARTVVYEYATLTPHEVSLVVDTDCWTAAVDASVYAGLMRMLGVESHCLDCSGETSINVERLAVARPDMLLVSAYDGVDTHRYQQLGVPLVMCRDFMEPSPLARAEWMRYLGRMWGVGERADSLFSVVEKEYRATAELGGEGDDTPTVLFDTLYGSIWYQPSPASTIGQMVSDAGGRLPFRSDQRGGSLSLSVEQVLAAARDADVWVIRSNGTLTLDALKALNPAYAQFRAFANGTVYAVDTTVTPYYEETPFRPDWLLADLRQMLHPELSTTLRYFKRLE